MTRSKADELVPFKPEPQRIARQQHRNTRARELEEDPIGTLEIGSSSSPTVKTEININFGNMADNNRTLKELTSPDVEYQPAYI